MVALVHGLLVGRGLGDREPHLDLAPLERAPDLEPRVLEHRQHRPVLRHHDGDEALDPGGARQRRELLEQARPDSAALEVVGDGERDLGRVGLAQPRVAREGDDALLARVAERPEQRADVGPVRLDPRLDEPAPQLREAVEAQVAAPLGEAGEELEQRVGVRGVRRAQAQGAAVPEDDVAKLGHGTHSVPIFTIGARPGIRAGAASCFGFSAARVRRRRRRRSGRARPASPARSRRGSPPASRAPPTRGARARRGSRRRPQRTGARPG